jgi:outer membrane protein assembly factor BamB
MGGRLVAVNTDNGSLLWASEQLKMAATSTGFGCAQGPTTVAIYGSPAVSDNLVYVGGYNGKVYSFIPGAGKSDRDFPDESRIGPIVGSVVAAQGRVYFGSTNGKVYALNDRLQEQWVFATKGKIWATPAIAGDTLFIGSFDKKLYAIDTTTGKEKWEKPFETEGAIVSTPLVYNNTVYVGSFDRHLYAVNAADGSLRWKFPATGEDKNNPGRWFWAKPVICNNTIYAPSLDGKVYILNAETGGEVADPINLGGSISSSPVLVGNSVVVATEAGIIYTVDTANNEKKKLASLGEKVFASLSAGQGSVFIHTASDALYAVDAASGALRKFTIK